MKINNEIKIGIMVVIAIVALTALTIRVGDFNFSKDGYDIKVHFKNIDGVDQNAPVRLNGMEVGLVKDIRILYEPVTTMELVLQLDKDVKLREGAKVYVKTLGMFGEKYIGLTSGDDDKPYLKPGGTLRGQEPADFELLLAKGADIADNLKVISENIKERLRINSEAIDEIVSSVRVATKNIASISANVDERLKVNDHLIDETIANLNAASQNLEEFSSDIKENPWKLLYKAKKKKAKRLVK